MSNQADRKVKSSPGSAPRFLEINDLSPDNLREIVNLSLQIKKEPKKYLKVLEGRKVGLFFEKPSMRTRVSFEVGIAELGACAINLNAGEIQLGVREPIEDVAQVLSRYLDVVMLRVNRHSDLEAFAGASSIPVINGLSDLSHPCQVLADVLTIVEEGFPDGIILSYFGDGNNVCNSLIDICSHFNIQVRVCAPKGYEPARSPKVSPYVLERDPRKAAAGAHVLYTDVWTSMGQESERLKRMKVFQEIKISQELLKEADPSAIVLHCLPAHRGEEISAEVIDGPQSRVFDQAENRLHAQKALLCKLLAN